jgi:hypothetical protein
MPFAPVEYISKVSSCFLELILVYPIKQPSSMKKEEIAGLDVVFL